MPQARSARNLRLVAAIATLAAAILPLSLLLTWGHLYGLDFAPLFQAFHGGDLPAWFRTALLSLSGVAVIVGIVAVFRPSRYPLLALLACLAMLAQVVLIVVEWNSDSVFVDTRWHWASGTVIAALAVGGAGAALWLGLFVSSVRGKRCPDCAERVPRPTIDCPHCGYRFPLSGRLKRCEACQRPVKAEARVCRYCHHRVGEPVEPSRGAA